MQLSLKAYYLSHCVDDVNANDIRDRSQRVDKKTLEALFYMLDKNNIEYDSLVIPITSLDIDKFIDPCECSRIAASREFRGIITESVIFDFYLPEFGYIFNINRINGASSEGKSDTQRLEILVGESLNRAESRARDWERFDDVTVDISWNILGELSFLKPATMDYLQSKEIRSLFSAKGNICDKYKTTDDELCAPIALDKIPALETALLCERRK